MSISDNALLQYEQGQTPQGKEALTDAGDHQTFSSASSPWSKRSGFAYDVKPNGLATGGAVISAASASNDVVDVAALSCYLAGVKTSVTAAVDQALTRGVTNGYLVNSITVTVAGAIAVVAGTESTAFVETRGAAGGPPLIPIDSIEVAQVRLTSVAAAAVLSTEIYQVVGTHQERYDYPAWDEDAALGQVVFDSALPLIHTGIVPKGVFNDYYTPIYANVQIAGDFQPAEESHSVNSAQYYGKTLSASSSTLGQSSFTAKLGDGVTDSLVKLANETLWFKFFQDRNKAPYILTQGKFGVTRTFPVSDHVQADCTISSEQASVGFDS